MPRLFNIRKPLSGRGRRRLGRPERGQGEKTLRWRFGQVPPLRRTRQGDPPMKTILFATAALVTAGTALAQTTTDTTMTTTTTTTATQGSTVAPANTAPERDARGIPVISDPATAPAGVNVPVTA